MTVLNIKCGFINCLVIPLFQDENHSPSPRDGKAFPRRSGGPVGGSMGRRGPGGDEQVHSVCRPWGGEMVFEGTRVNVYFYLSHSIFIITCSEENTHIAYGSHDFAGIGKD